MSPNVPVRALFVGLLATALTAQCQNVWTGAYGCPGVAGSVECMVHWDPDGAGPQPEQLVIGGAFSVAGTTSCRSLAMWDAASGEWSALALPVPVPVSTTQYAYVSALAVLPGGELAAVVQQYGGLGMLGHVATWDGVAWTVLGAQFDERIDVMIVRSGGQLLVGGSFTTIGGAPSAPLVEWNGAGWQPFGGGVTGAVHDLVERPGGVLMVGGLITVGGVQSAVQQWSGTAWSAVGNLAGEVRTLAAVGGQLFAGTQGGLQLSSGSSWSTVPGLDATPYPTASISRLRALPNGRLAVGGMFVAAGGQPTAQFALYDPAAQAWTTLGAGVGNGHPLLGSVAAIEPLANGDLVVGGGFSHAGDLDVASIARHDGATWHALSSGPGYPQCIAALDDQQFVIGGRFRTAGDLVVNSVAQWDGAAWQALGGGLIDPASSATDLAVQDLLQLDNGGVLAAGRLGATYGSIARWDGIAWAPFAVAMWNGNPSWVACMLQLPDGDLVVGGAFTTIAGVPAANVARWDGANWNAYPAGPGQVAKLQLDAGGALLVVENAAVRRWDGSQWQTIASVSGNHSIRSVAATRDGGVMIAGIESLYFGSSTRGWVEYQGPAGFLHEETEISGGWIRVDVIGLPDGDVLAMGSFGSLGGVPVSGSVRFDQPPFGARDSSLTGYWLSDHDVLPNGDLLLPGGIDDAGGAGNHLIARLTTTCPASAPTFGAGCVGSGGTNQLRARDLPWLGASYRSEASGLAANALAIDVFGLSTGQVPLASLLPQGQPGCDLLVAPEVLLLRLTGAGTFETTFPIADSPVLLGRSFHEQVVALELDAQGSILAITSSNGVSATIGAF